MRRPAPVTRATKPRWWTIALTTSPGGSSATWTGAESVGIEPVESSEMAKTRFALPIRMGPGLSQTTELVGQSTAVKMTSVLATATGGDVGLAASWYHLPLLSATTSRDLTYQMPTGL